MSSPGSRWAALRLTDAKLLKEYRANTRLWLRVGNTRFAQHIRTARGLWRARDSSRGQKVLYHAWLPGDLHLRESQAARVQQLIHGAGGRPLSDDVEELAGQLDHLGWATGDRVDLDELVRRTQDRFVAIQNPTELRRFLQKVRALQPSCIVEIGTARGGVLYSLCQVAAPNALIVSIDLPGAPNCGGQTGGERQLFHSFGYPGQTLRFIPEDSHRHTTWKALRDILGRRRVDLLFIDGDHSYGGVRMDFEMYSPLVRPQGLIALHDITGFPDEKAGFEVGIYWREIKRRFRALEIVDPNGARHLDGTNRARAWGIGLVCPGETL